VDEVAVPLCAPLLGEPLAIELANTYFAVRGLPQEGLATLTHLTGWLEHHRDACGTVQPGTVTESDRVRFVALRDAIRAIAAAVVDQHPMPDAALAVVNASAAAAPSWPALVSDGTGVTITQRRGGAPPAAALAAVGRSAVEVFGGELRARVRACGGPECVLFFVKNHPRREWCSAGCGNRARVRRYHQRQRGAVD